MKNCAVCLKKVARKDAKYCSRACYFSVPVSYDTRAKLSAAGKGRTPKNFQDFLAKGQAATRGHPLSAQHRRKVSEALRNSPRFQAAMKSPEFRVKMTAVLRRIPRATRERHWNWQGGKSFDPVNVKKVIAHNNRRQKLRRKAVPGSHTSVAWEALKARYGGKCLRCQKQEPEIKLTVDHIRPISKGGTNNISNIQPLCFSCNSWKRAKLINYISVYGYAA